MAADGAGGNSSWVQWALGLLAAAWAGGTLFLYGRVREVRREDSEGRGALWQRVNKQRDDAAEGFLEAERRYATGEDLDKLAIRLERNLAASEQRIMDAIVNRPPVRQT